MSTPLMNHTSHMHHHHQQQQEQQQQQSTNEMQTTHSNLVNQPHGVLTRSDSTSTVILEEEQPLTRHRNGTTTTQPPLLANLSAQLRSLLKTSGLFNNDWESDDVWNEIFADGNDVNLSKLLSDGLGITDLTKLESIKPLDAKTVSEYLRSASFDRYLASEQNAPDVQVNASAIINLPSSFSELRPLSPELTTNDQLNYLQMNSFDYSTHTPNSEVYDQNQGALNGFEHDHAFLSKRMPVSDVPSSSTTTISTTTSDSKRAQTRNSARIQSRAKCSTVIQPKSKRTRTVNRAKDIQTPDDLNYYLERRRKNNEASKVSRAVRKQKFGDMDKKCTEYQRTNAELRVKIETLEKVTASLKSGLVNNFQKKYSL